MEISRQRNIWVNGCACSEPKSRSGSLTRNLFIFTDYFFFCGLRCFDSRVLIEMTLTCPVMSLGVTLLTKLIKNSSLLNPFVILFSDLLAEHTVVF